MEGSWELVRVGNLEKEGDLECVHLYLHSTDTLYLNVSTLVHQGTNVPGQLHHSHVLKSATGAL